MTALRQSSQWISSEEYLEGERLSDVRHEYIDGCVYAMAGASDDHNRIAGNIFVEVSNQLRGHPYEAFTNDMKVKVSPDSSLFYYPDVLVACDPRDSARYFREHPSVIFEVISPETERADRREKLLAYREIQSLTSYIIVEPDQMIATAYRRAGGAWDTERLEGADAVLRLPEVKVSFPLARIFERTAVARTTGDLR